MDRLAVACPAKTRFAAHRAVAQAAVGYPLADYIPDEFDFAAEIVGGRDALQLGVNLGTFSG